MPSGHNGRSTPLRLQDSLEQASIRDDEQMLSDQEQTNSDRDQTASDRDQAASDRDEEASAADQALSDRDRAEGGDPVKHALNREARQRTSAERQSRSASRDRTAFDRLRIATERDQASDRRDTLSAANDLRLRGPLGSSLYLGLEEARAKAAADRLAAATDRLRAADDRRAAASARAALRERVARIPQGPDITGFVEATSVGIPDQERGDSLESRRTPDRALHARTRRKTRRAP